jgi:hypothetical protein
MTDDHPRLAAIVFPKGFHVDGLLADVVATLTASGLRVAGVVQEAVATTPDRCDTLVLRDMTDRTTTCITEDRGAQSAGCRLDPRGLAEVAAKLEAVLDTNPDLLVINRFGKAESEGGGLRAVLTTALMRGIPVLTAVRDLNVAGWQSFHEGTAQDLPPVRGAVDDWVAAWRPGA